MTNKTVRKTYLDIIAQFCIDKGKIFTDISNPLALAKDLLNYLEQHNEDRFINEALNNIKSVDTESLKAIKFLERLYKSVQVIEKATSRDKKERLRQLSMSGAIKQDVLTEPEYELFLKYIEELTDTEFLILLEIDKIEQKNAGEVYNPETSNKAYRELINKLNMQEDTLNVYISRLKGKGLITAPESKILSLEKDKLNTYYLGTQGNFGDGTAFFICDVEGNVSTLFKRLLHFLNSSAASS